MTGSRLHSVAFSVPKLGRHGQENEDSVATDPLAGRFAVADGASTSARPEVWSRLLVEAFVRDGVDPLAPEVLAQLRGRWAGLVNRVGLPWYAQAKLQQGGASTFLGLRIDTEACGYDAIGVGDSCLFHVRGDRVLTVGPIDRADAFDNYPQLINSRMEAPAQKATRLAGEYLPGDEFLLATDAIARLLLTMHERHHRIPPLDRLCADREGFVRLVLRHRRRGHLANDDTTLCMVRT